MRPAVRPRPLRLFAAVAALIATGQPVVALPAPPGSVQATPSPHAADHVSEDAIIAALYAVISGPAGQARDWDRFRALFLPGATLTGTGAGPDGTPRARRMTVEDYIARNGPVLTGRGFFETETGRRSERLGAVTALLSGYESRATPEAAPFDRGVNAIHLFNDGQRWWVVAVTWASIPPGETPPAGLLPD
ncbi:MAG TPA: hypothetical protein VGN74_10830 [Brevundimonas sp.]|jgi:hypothetical protein|uniref:hypothetical protein n=1 Tax=Brevundimonas sp. TaxID=1871086 RepID=UPI002E130F8D|nr:hypothetical protein [Brevundimonas sp.]